jgi:PAS domain S-box-containing protein
MQSAISAEPLPVLVVDDDSVLIRTLADILRMHGYAPATAETATRGLQLAKQRAPALAVVDLRLPDMDGMELASRLHELSELTEVVVLTGNASVDSAIAALREHSMDYLVKPVNVDRLLQVASLATERFQRRQAEEKLRDSDARFRRVYDSNMMGVMFWNADGLVTEANDKFLHIVGYRRDELEAGEVNWRTLTPPEYSERDREKLATVMRDGFIEPYEKEYARKDGTRVPVMIGAALLEKRKDGGVSFVLDITDRVRAEHAAEVRAKQQAAVAKFGQRALVTREMKTLFEDAIALVADTLQLPFTGVLERRPDSGLSLRAGAGWDGLLPLDTPIHAPDGTQWGYTLAHKEPTIVENAMADRRFTPTAYLDPYRVASGVTVVIPSALQPYGILVAHDRRPRKFTQDDVHFLQAIAHVLGTTVERDRSEAAIRQSQRMEAVGRLAGGVSHDFNNMLAAITGFGEIVRAGLRPEDPMRNDVEEILKAAKSAAALTKQLLAFSRQQTLQTREVHLGDVVTGMEGMVRRLIGPDIALVTSFEEPLAPIKADPGQLEQVILNLCVNARDAMPDGGRITVEALNTEIHGAGDADETSLPPGPYVMLAVTDTGTGMDAETRARIFEPFFTTKPAEKGTGLGLATVYGIVKQSGGEIAVQSELGHGTTFRIFLPRVETSTEQHPHDNGRGAHRH